MQLYLTAGLALIALVALVVVLLSWIRYIPNNRVGLVEKLVSQRGSVKEGLIALHGEAGFQPDILRGGWHILMPFQYKIHSASLVTVPQGRLGYVFARDGAELLPTQTLASNTKANDFQDVRHFFNNGGQRGPQRQILREGTYAINLVQFVVITPDQIFYHQLSKEEVSTFKAMAHAISERNGFDPVVISGRNDQIGIVTVHDGPSLGQGELIAPTVGDEPSEAAEYHNGFQDPERFLNAGGRRGRQLQILVDGTYYINRLFASVELMPKLIIEVGTVGVVVSYTGEQGSDLSGESYRHGELVTMGRKGVWSEPLLPGKYGFNWYAGSVQVVPTTNIILKWKRAEQGAHKLDENLHEIGLITKDAFEPSLPLSVVIHIDYQQAPLVIQRFGDVKKLVEQTLDPMVASYFKNVGQTRTLIQLIQERSAIQDVASEEMKARFAHYNLQLEEVLIGTPTANDERIEELLTQLRARQIAEEQVITYGRQQKAAAQERELVEAQSIARQQKMLTESEIGITIQGNEGRAATQRAMQQAEQTRVIASADAERIRILGAAEAEREATVGLGRAIAVEEQVRAYGGSQAQIIQQVMTEMAHAIQHSGVELVPRIQINSGGGAQGSNVLQDMLTLLLSDQLEGTLQPTTAEQDPQTLERKQQLRQRLLAGLNGSAKSSVVAMAPVTPVATAPLTIGDAPTEPNARVYPTTPLVGSNGQG